MLKKNNFFLVSIYAVITFFTGIIIIFNVDSFNKTVSLKNFYSDESISFEISGDYSEVLSNDTMKKIFSNNGDFMILKQEIRNNLSGIYLSGNYKNYLNISSGESLNNEKYKNKAVATRGNNFWKYNDIGAKEYIDLHGTNYEIIGIHNFNEIPWYEHRGIINLTDNYLFSGKFPIAGQYILDGPTVLQKFNEIKKIIEENTDTLTIIINLTDNYLFSGKFPIAGQYILDGPTVLQKFNEIKKIIEENTDTLTITLSENVKLYELLSFFIDSLPIFIFMFLISCIFILNIINITRNWFLTKLKILGIMRAFGATKKDITIFSIKIYLKQVLIGFINIINITRNWFLTKLKILGIMRAFGATKKDITIFSIKIYLKQVLIGFIIGYSIFIINLLIKKTLINLAIQYLLLIYS